MREPIDSTRSAANPSSATSCSAPPSATASKAANKGLENNGFGFAGKAQGGEVVMLTLGTTLGSGVKRKVVVPEPINAVNGFGFLVPNIDAPNGDFVAVLVGVGLGAIEENAAPGACVCCAVLALMTGSVLELLNELMYALFHRLFFVLCCSSWSVALHETAESPALPRGRNLRRGPRGAGWSLWRGREGRQSGTKGRVKVRAARASGWRDCCLVIRARTELLIVSGPVPG